MDVKLKELKEKGGIYMTIKELNTLKEQIGLVNEFNKNCLLKEYDNRYSYKNNNIAIEEYKNQINMSIQRLTLRCEELTGVDMNEFFETVKIDKNLMYDVSTLEYLQAVRIMDCHYNCFYKLFLLIINTL